MGAGVSHQTSEYEVAYQGQGMVRVDQPIFIDARDLCKRSPSYDAGLIRAQGRHSGRLYLEGRLTMNSVR